jgi:hypothetical protein
MALPSSGTLAMSTIASSVGTVSPHSMNNLTRLTAVGSNASTFKSSNFYSWPDGGYKNGNPAILFDFGLNANYSNSGSTVSDRSGNGRNGTFVTGTGNGSSATIDQYTGTFPGQMNIPGDSPQKSVRLDDYAKFSGTANYTVIAWVKITSFTSSYPGVVGAEGRSGGTPFGWSMHFDNASGYNLNHSRWSGTSGTLANISINFGSGGVPSFAFDRWYMVSARFNGSTMSLSLHTAGSRYDASTGNSYSLSTDASWSAFLGLRYNNWQNGPVGYMAIYGSDLGTTVLDTIYAATRIRYGNA